MSDGWQERGVITLSALDFGGLVGRGRCRDGHGLQQPAVETFAVGGGGTAGVAWWWADSYDHTSQVAVYWFRRTTAQTSFRPVY